MDTPREDHPRRCGENFGGAKRYTPSPGSPPQVRGKHQPRGRIVRAHGITPAGAGKTTRPQDEQLQYIGSPPQVRGKPSAEVSFGGAYGITPAGAGKTPICLTPHFTIQDHPRRCGENRARPLCSRRKRGSPPQVRGKQSFVDGIIMSTRITPAGAGKTVKLYFTIRNNRDHPRRCGENIHCFIRAVYYPGSPPQVRGKLAVCVSINTADRITPAGAGKT